MSKYAGTESEKNILAAFAGESQARNKYTYFAHVAKVEGIYKIADVFTKTASNEENHAKMWLKELEGIGDSKANLTAAANGENAEWTDMYVKFAETADNEKEHAKMWFKLLNGGDIGTTAENLKAAADGEN